MTENRQIFIRETYQGPQLDDWIKVFCTLISKQKKQIIINMKKEII